MNTPVLALLRYFFYAIALTVLGFVCSFDASAVSFADLVHLAQNPVAAKAALTLTLALWFLDVAVRPTARAVVSFAMFMVDALFSHPGTAYPMPRTQAQATDDFLLAQPTTRRPKA